MDTRALDPEVFQAAAAAVRERAAAGGTFRALEVGAGAGNAFPRWMRLLGPVRRLSFTATDAHADLLAAYRREVVRWARAGGLELRPAARGGLLLKGRLRSGAPGDPDARTGPTERTLEVRFARARVPAGLRDRPPGHLDLLLAQSFWDLAPRGTPLRLARELLAPGGVFYAALTFSGVTRFHPALKEDREVLAAYHASMEVPGRGDSRAGARLVAEARERASGLAELASGRSDWRVEPSPEGGYPGDEAFFLETILEFFEKELEGTPGFPGGLADRWLGVRRRQLREGRLSFHARQHDLAARRRRDPPA